MNIFYPDEEIRRLVKESLVTALSQRWLAQRTNYEDFYDEAEELIKDIDTDILRYFCSETIRSFSYGRKPIDILTQVENFRSSASSQASSEEVTE